MSKTIDVKKQGQVFTVFHRSGRPVPLANFDDAPTGAEPTTFVGEPMLRAQFPGHEFNFLESKPSAPRERAHEVALREPRPRSITSERQAGLIYFQRLLDRYKWCDADSKGTVKVQCEAAAHLLIEMFPGIEEELAEMKKKTNNPGFSLE